MFDDYFIPLINLDRQVAALCNTKAAHQNADAPDKITLQYDFTKYFQEKFCFSERHSSCTKKYVKQHVHLNEIN